MTGSIAGARGRPESAWVYKGVPATGAISPAHQSSAWVDADGPAKPRSLALVNWFKVELDGGLQSLGFWNAVSGLSVSWNMLEYRVGDQGNDRWYFPGVTTYSNIVLKRAACKDSQLVKKWLDRASFTYRTPVNGLITLYAAEGPSDATLRTQAMMSSDQVRVKKPAIMAWELKRMMPLKWNIDGFDASGNKVAIETLELTHEGFLSDDHKPRAR